MGDFEVDADLDGIQHQGNPPMVMVISETVKRFSKGKIANQVERYVVVPADNVNRVALRDLIVELLDEQIRVAMKQSLLLEQCLM